MSIDSENTSRMELMVDLMKRSTERIQILTDPTADQYKQIMQEIEDVLGQLNELLVHLLPESLPIRQTLLSLLPLP
jgi:hypothetical protein